MSAALRTEIDPNSISGDSLGARQRGATLLIVTHDAALAQAADRVLELKDGRLQEASS